MLELLMTPVLALAPQDPVFHSSPVASEATTKTVAVPERWLPKTALASFALTSDKNDSWRQLLATPELEGLRAVVASMLADAGMTVPAAVISAAFTRGLAIGLLDLDPVNGADLLLVADVGDAIDALASTLEQLPTDEHGLYLLGEPTSSVWLGRQGTFLVAGTVAASVRDAMRHTQGSASTTLADDPDFLRSVPADGTRVAHLFVRPGRLASRLVAERDGQATWTNQLALRVLGLQDMPWATASWRFTANKLVGRYQLATPTVTGLFDALAGTTGRLDQSLARFVPEDAIGMGFFAVEAGAVFDEAMALAHAAAPAAATTFEQTVANLEDHAGVDFRAELIGGLSGRILSITLGSLADSEHGLLLELRQPGAFRRSLSRLMPALPVPLQEGTSAGTRCWRAPSNDAGSAAAVAVVGDWLAIASSDSALVQIVQQVQDPKASPSVTKFLRGLPLDAAWATHGPFAVPPGPWFEVLGQQLAKLGPRRLVVRRSVGRFLADESVAASDALRATTAIAASCYQAVTGRPMDPEASRAVQGADPLAVATLVHHEKQGLSSTGTTEVSALLEHDSPGVVARAAWLLGQWSATGSAELLGTVATSHPSASVRLQAISSLTGLATVDSVAVLAAAADDDDPRIRTLAIQTLGRLGTKAAIDPVMAVLDQRGSTATDNPTDLVVALVVLHDIGEAQHLLPAASSIGFAHPQVGQALAFLFQGLTPRMDAKDQVATLLAVLDHPEPVLRRYSIQRLGELRDVTTVPALEGRLAVEGLDLQPLIRVSLAQVRGDIAAPADDLVARAKSNVTAVSKMVEQRWGMLDGNAQIMVIGLGCVILASVIVLLLTYRRSRRRTTVAEATALIEPSEEHQEHLQWDEEPEDEEQYETVGAAPNEERS